MRNLGRPGPRYAKIEEGLRAAIDSGLLPAGTVVIEDPVARLFGTSRTPVRMALIELERHGLLERFDGRGFVVPGALEPNRVALTHAMLGLSDTTAAPPPVTSERIARDFESSLAQALPFGLYHVHEQAAANYYGVSRTIVRELLSRFQDRGLVRKDLRSHWVLGPLTARDVQHYFAIRERLEPFALVESAPSMPSDILAGMLERSRAAIIAGDSLPPDQLRQLETDIHVTLLANADNPHLLRMIHQSQIALTVNQVFAETVGTRPFANALQEHCIVLEFLIRGSWGAAARALEEHLHLSAARTRRRLMSISVFPEPVLPDYLRRRPA
jgi:DNA-binding GntR family transcriptional regulator